VLLTPARTAKSALRRRGGVDGYRFVDDPEPGALLASTIHGFKGLERPVVILAEIGERHGEDLATYLYVGASRARNHLIVLAREPVDRDLRALAGLTGAPAPGQGSPRSAFVRSDDEAGLGRRVDS
jgi:hypothetical protein